MTTKSIVRLAPLCAALVLLVSHAARGETLAELYEKAKAEKEVVFYSGGPAAPHENRARRRIDGNVEAVLRPIVHEHVEVQRRGNLAARPVHHEHRWRLVAARNQPAVALILRGVPFGFRAAREENQLPASFLDEAEQARERAGLDLVEGFPEVHAGAHGAPQLALLPRGQGVG